MKSIHRQTWRAAAASAAAILGTAALAALPARQAAGQTSPVDGRSIYPGANTILHGAAPLGPADGRRIYPGAAVILNGDHGHGYGGYGGFSFHGPFHHGYWGGGGIVLDFGFGYVPWYYGGFDYGYYGGPYYSYNPYNPPVYVQPYPAYGYPYSPRYVPPPVPDSEPREPVPAQPTAPPAGTPTPTPNPAAAGGSDDYYLNRKPTPLDRDASLRRAVADIENAFRTGNVGLLESHLDMSQKLTLMKEGHTREPLDAALYVEMTRDALANITTVSYTLNHVEPGSNGTWLVYGTHVLHGQNGSDKTFNVSFVLKKVADRWVITEVSADAAK